MSPVRLRPPHVRLPARPAERARHEAVIPLLALAARVPPRKPLIQRLVTQIVVLALRDQDLRLLRQTRHVHETRRPAARTPAHETLLCLPMEGLRADVARLAFRVFRAFLDRDRDGLLVFFVGVVLLRVAAAVYLLTHLLVAAAPVVMLASFVAVSRLASNTSRRVVGQWSGAGGACCEDHLAFLR